MAFTNKKDHQYDEKPAQILVEDSMETSKLPESAAEQGDYSGAVAKSSAAEIALVRKMDIRIMSILWAMYFLNYLDRNAIAQARLNDLEDDLGLVGSQYNTCIIILFVG